VRGPGQTQYFSKGRDVDPWDVGEPLRPQGLDAGYPYVSKHIVNHDLITSRGHKN